MNTFRFLMGAVFFSLLSLPAFAQIPIDLWLVFNPRIFEYKTFGSGNGQAYTSEPVDGQATDFDLAEYRLTVGGQPWNADDRELLLVANYHRLDIETAAVLPLTGLGIPGRLENLNVGVGYRHILEDDTIVGGILQIGSASDDLFHSFEETYVGGNFFVRVPRNRRDGWLYLLNVDFNRDFPVIPGFAYQHRDTVYKMILGFPLSEIEYRPREKLTLQASYTPVNTVDATATYAVSRVTRVFASFRWREFFFRRVARLEDDAIMEYDERRIETGLRFDISDNVTATLSGGYVFGRRFAEGDGFSDRRDNDIKIRDAKFVKAGFRYFFR